MVGKPMNRSLSVFLLLGVVSGCLHRVPPPAPAEQLSPEQVLARVRAADAGLVGLTGEARLKARTPQGRGASTLYVAVQRPGLLRLESMDFFGRPQSILVTDGQRFGLHQVAEGRFYRGPATAANLSRFLPVVLPAEELVGLLLGQAPVLVAEQRQARYDPEQGTWELTLRSGPAVQRLKVDARDFKVRESLVEGVAAYDLRFSDVRQEGGAWVAHEVQLDAEQAGVRLELVYRDPEVNSAPDLSLYDLSPPPDVPVTEVDGEGSDTP
jgi:hypothetical protein